MRATAEELLSVTAAMQNSAVMVGEPVVLELKITNRSNETLWVQGVHSWRWSEPSVTNLSPQRQRVARAKTHGIEISYSGGIEIPAVLEPGQTVTNTWVLSWNYSFLTPGPYEVRFPLDLRPEIRNRDSSYTKRNPLRSDLSVPFSVTPADPAHLREIAGRLFAAIPPNGKDLFKTEPAFQSLFSMPDEFAATYWRTLALDHEKYGYLHDKVLEALRRWETRTTIDILAEMWGPNLAPLRDLSARRALVHLYVLGDSSLRPTIGRIFFAREGKLPPLPTGRIIQIDGMD